MTRAIWYTAFHEASLNNNLILSPPYYVYTGDEAGFSLDDQFYKGATGLLLKPSTKEGTTSADVYLADDEVYYDYFHYKTYSQKAYHTVSAPLHKIPLFARGDDITLKKDNSQRSNRLIQHDPITLVLLLGKSGNAHHTLYIDDTETFDSKSGAQILTAFTPDAGSSTLSSRANRPTRSTDPRPIAKIWKAYGLEKGDRDRRAWSLGGRDTLMSRLSRPDSRRADDEVGLQIPSGGWA